ncbi:MAG: hypothetical protein KJ698_08600 [Actinobacteria bacterium]|nr:hypothetical protein [Actinomycetota bacterium]MBU1492518.1 hypothetical protein [Actinomycetota bacterium]MBU1864845.1 hypothetical protein [Actinomycetota bacterium]
MTEGTPAAKPSFFEKLKGWFTKAKESEAAEKIGDVAEKTWDKTKDVAEKTWDKTKDVAEDVKEWGEEKIEDLRHKDDDGEEAKPE